MDKMQCAVARDLMPLVADEVASEASKTLVSEHMKECESCRAYYEGMTLQMTKPVPAQETQTAFVQFCGKMKKRVSVRKLLAATILLILAASILLVGFQVYEHKTNLCYQQMPIQWMNVELQRDVDGSVLLRIEPDAGKHWFWDCEAYERDGVYYINPIMPEWPFAHLGTSETTVRPMDDLRWENGRLYDVVEEWDVVYNEETRSYEDQITVHKKPVSFVRWGNWETFVTIYERGDDLAMNAGISEGEPPLAEKDA